MPLRIERKQELLICVVLEMLCFGGASEWQWDDHDDRMVPLVRGAVQLFLPCFLPANPTRTFSQLYR